MDQPKKKVVRVESSTPAKADGSAKKSADAASSDATGAAEKSSPKTPAWTPSKESKSKATRNRIISWALWIVAIALEIFILFWVRRQDWSYQPTQVKLFVLLIVGMVVIGGLALGANLLWRQANRLDPASEENKFKFWVQNQLGLIMTIIAFVPLIVVVLTNSNMNGKQKALAGGIGVLLALGIGLGSGVTWDSPSREQYADEENIVATLTGADTVFWTKDGKVFHVCDAVPDVNRQSKDNQIYTGTVADAHAAGKDRLTKNWRSEATKWCGYTDEDVARVEESLNGVPSVPGNKAPTGIKNNGVDQSK